jgi:hypothetical protein
MVTKAERLAKKLFGSAAVKPGPGSDKLQRRSKVVVFVPLEKADELTFAMASAGAGTIGNYTLCSFRTAGVGTFMGNESSNPLLGEKGNFEMAGEVRLEMICGRKNVGQVIRKIYEVHPYDEPAFEVYDVLTGTGRPGGEILEIGLKKKLPVKSLLKKINPRIASANIPAKMKDMKISKCIIDCSENSDVYPADPDGKTIYIKKNKKNIKAYLI